MDGFVVPLLIAGIASQAIGQIQQGNAAKAAGKFNAQVASNNAVASRASAAEDARRFRRVARKQQGQRRLLVSSLDVLEGKSAIASSARSSAASRDNAIASCRAAPDLIETGVTKQLCNLGINSRQRQTCQVILFGYKPAVSAGGAAFRLSKRVNDLA